MYPKSTCFLTEAYKKQIQKVRDDRDEYTRLLEQAQHSINDAFMETATTIIELAIDAKKLWKLRNAEERLAFFPDRRIAKGNPAGTADGRPFAGIRARTVWVTPKV